MKETYNTPIELGNLKNLISKYCTKEWQQLIKVYKSSEEYKKNEIIFSEGEPLNSIHIIETGKVKIYSAFNKEKERIIRLAADEYIIGHRGIGEDFTYSASAMALTNTKISLIPLDLFKSLLKANSEFCYYFMLFFAEELRRAERHIKNMESMTAIQKVAKALILNIEAFGYENTDKTRLSYTLSRKDLSSITGSTYETIVRVLSLLNEAKLIRIDGKKIHILSEEKLKQLIDRGLE